LIASERLASGLLWQKLITLWTGISWIPMLLRLDPPLLVEVPAVVVVSVPGARVLVDAVVSAPPAVLPGVVVLEPAAPVSAEAVVLVEPDVLPGVVLEPAAPVSAEAVVFGEPEVVLEPDMPVSAAADLSLEPGIALLPALAEVPEVPSAA